MTNETETRVMQRVNRALAVAGITVAAIIGGKTAVSLASLPPLTKPTVRYTKQAQHYLHHFRCNEDEYLFIPSKYVNPNVTYNTPVHPLCIQIDDHNYRKAERIR